MKTLMIAVSLLTLAGCASANPSAPAERSCSGAVESRELARVLAPKPGASGAVESRELRRVLERCHG